MARPPRVVGNWKMYGLQSAVGELQKIIAGARALSKVELIICPPATLIATFAAAARGSRVAIGGQDCHALASGAYTGDISAEMLKDAGAAAVIVGHSERRQYHRETDATVREKVLAAKRAGLLAIICVGEMHTERTAARALSVVRARLDGSLPEEPAECVIAYEPAWAIGTGLTPTPGDVGEMHQAIRDWLRSRYGTAAVGIGILYGGSVNPANAKELLAVQNVDGVLVGGASLKADELLAIADTYQ